ncbi:MAG: hypothetical protein HY964_10385 [Ignavibacteriales bacterium]|nr:hypothetical protein [Ignavibacteriales bacterium]
MIQLLLFLITIFIIKKEPNKKNRFIFINFAIFFSLSIFSLGFDFIDNNLFVEKYSKHFYFQYVLIAYVIFNALAIIYLVIDLLFRDFKIYQKYICSLLIVLSIAGFVFYPYFYDPKYLYETNDIKQWKIIDQHIRNSTVQLSALEIANQLTLKSWENGHEVAELLPEENLRRIESLIPYLEKDNWRVLLFAPLYRHNIYMDVLIIGFILLFFGYQYKKDPPQGAYIDKIMFLVLILSSMDIIHNWGFIKSVEWGSLAELFAIGQYITVFAELMMVLLFAFRLKFISSIHGEFYETELAVNPEKISRWRDWIDNLVLAHFFNFKLFNGRLFQNPSEK